MGRIVHAQLGRYPRRGNEKPYFAVITSEAKQSILSSRPYGLLRRFAPRNDDLQNTLCLRE
jgi:hypothetical protein